MKNINKFISVFSHSCIIQDPLNLRYLTGTDIDTGTLVFVGGKVYFITDFRYIEKAKSDFKNSDVTVILQSRLSDNIRDILSSHNETHVFIENGYQTVEKLNFFSGICEVEREALLDNAINELRMIKDEEELALIKKAQNLTDSAFTHILPFIKEGVKERDIALEIEWFMRKGGAEGVSFNHIVVSGKKSSLPHGIPSDKLIENGDFITMDTGCKVGGYCSDMTRTVALGYADDDMKKVYNTVLSAQKAALDLIAPDVVCCDIDTAARSLIYGAGYEGCFGHSTGHSVGLFIHESPSFSPSCKTLLKKGMVMTVEPGINIEDAYGVRIEDMVYITDDGYENLTKSSKELIIL